MTYLGFSYGTFLGATIQSLFPGKTRAVVLDGALDPDQYINDPLGSLDEQTAGFERAISRFMIACAADQEAAASARATRSARSTSSSTRPTRRRSRRRTRPAGRSTATTFAPRSCRTSTRSSVAGARLRAGGARRRDGNGIRFILDNRFYGRNDDGTYDPAIDRYFLLSADEQNYPRPINPFLLAGKQSYQDYDHAYWNHGYAELNWGLYPIRARGKFDGPFRTSAKDPTTLVVGTRYDPATPYKEAQRLTAQLGNARLLTMTGDGHTAYDGYPADGYNSECVDDAVNEYLFGLALPAVGTKCAQDQEAFPAPEPIAAQAAAPGSARSWRAAHAADAAAVAASALPAAVPPGAAVGGHLLGLGLRAPAGGVRRDGGGLRSGAASGDEELSCPAEPIANGVGIATGACKRRQIRLYA